MRRRSITSIQDPKDFQKKLLAWGAAHKTMIWLDSNDHHDTYSNFDALLAVGVATELRCEMGSDAFSQLSTYRKQTKDWIFGHLTYDLKNELEGLDSRNKESIYFPKLYFFQPEKIFTLRGKELQQLYLTKCNDQAEIDLKTIQNQGFLPKNGSNNLKIEARFSKSEYIAQVEKMLNHIYRGDIYEANLCQEFFAQGKIDALQTFIEFNQISQAPFATYFKQAEKYLLCTSPERYIQKNSERIISQPIKGTARRNKNRQKDAEIGQELTKNEKERSENIMITDLVRNDLSRFAQKGSVQVEHLCALQTYQQVHQLVSTISAQCKPDTDPIEILKNTFPMGSMTGAPKRSAMKIIEQLEHHKRGLYSGAVGYFNPEGDFDFNVVIRSILYDSEKKKLSFSVGSAITAKSDPEKEYEECLLKAKAMRKVLSK